MKIDISWIYSTALLLLGFLSKVLLDALKSPNLKIVAVSGPFSFSSAQVSRPGFDNNYKAYRIRVENKQKWFLNCAAENCMAWLELKGAPESYQICWVGNRSEVTINIGDVREVDFVARENTTGSIYAPTERGYFAPLSRGIGDGKKELFGKLRITSRNGRKEEKRFVVKPNANKSDGLNIELRT